MTRPDGLVGLTLGPRQTEIYLRLVDDTMSPAEQLAMQLRAVEIVAAHEKVGAMQGRHL